MQTEYGDLLYRFTRYLVQTHKNMAQKKSCSWAFRYSEEDMSSLEQN